jgi:amino acid transporter
MSEAAELKRTLGLGLLVLYGLGVTVGAGIYVLVGTAATRAGVHTPVAFLLAAAIMALSAASFAELSARFPVSAGEAAYVGEGFRSRHLSLIVGLLVVAAGVVSAAAISRGAAGYVGVLVPGPLWLLTVIVVAGMGLVAAWGITEAVALAALMTLIEIGGLVTIIIAGLWRDPSVLSDLPLAVEGLGEAAAWPGILGASLVAFFAFIGFEGIVNVAEEVKQPERTLPLAIALTIVVTAVLYILVVWVIIRSVPPAEIAASKAPVSLAYERLTGASPLAISLIAIVATVNGIIVQMVMASRVLYGLARRGALPARLAHISKRTKTPLPATAIVVGVTLALGATLPIERLADAATRVMLVIFALVNAALFAIKLRKGPAHPAIEVPKPVPVLGALSCSGLLLADLLR